MFSSFPPCSGANGTWTLLLFRVRLARLQLLSAQAHNDAMRVYESKLREMGVAVEETGFVPLHTTTSLGPAGLVAAPKI